MSAPGHQARRSRAAVAALAVSVLAAFCLLIALGTWQVQRLHWKEALIATIDQRIHAAPIPLDELAALDDIEYVPVRLSGTFLHRAERHVFTTHRGQSGYNVYTPLVMAGGEAVFVNRGFVPFERKEAATRPAGQVEGTVEIVGLARRALTEKPSFIVPDNEPANNVFHWKDLDAMRASSGLEPAMPVLGFFVDANDAPNPGGLPVGGTTIVELPNNHLQYAVTWYGLAAALVLVCGFWLLRRLRARP